MTLSLRLGTVVKVIRWGHVPDEEALAKLIHTALELPAPVSVKGLHHGGVSYPLLAQNLDETVTYTPKRESE
ncbi:hypothetical protein HDV00_004985 [Rhizophlyctis rosea]|nr:hypothetical protein HDV00_004985 [Rhizophlyctis rosea]